MNAGDTCSAFATLSKPSSTLVDGQQLRGIDVEREQILDRVRVLVAVQPMQRECSPDRGSGCAADRAAPPSTRRTTRLSRLRAVAAGRRHHVAAQLAHDLLPSLGVLSRSRRGSSSRARGPRCTRPSCGSRAIRIEHRPWCAASARARPCGALRRNSRRATLLPSTRRRARRARCADSHGAARSLRGASLLMQRRSSVAVTGWS